MNVSVLRHDDNELVLDVCGRVDSQTAKEFQRMVDEARATWPAETLVLDMGAVGFLSSAGLRALLRLQRTKPLRVVNVGPSLMEVFQDTGFTSILDIRKAIPTISLDGCELIGQGANGEVYRLTRETVVKLFAEGTPLSAVEHERELAQRSLIHGIPTAITYNLVQANNRYGAVFELVEAESLSHVLRDHPERFDEYARQYVDIYRSFHQTTVRADEFPSIKDVYHGYIDGCVDWYTPEQVGLLRRVVDSVPDRDTLIHGDYHANNILVAEDELIMIDMGDVSLGHPIFDFLATAATQANLVELNPAYAEAHTGMPVSLIRRLWSYLIDTYFADRGTQEVARIDRQVRLFSKLKVACAPVLARNAPREIIEASVADAKQSFLPRADELVGSVDW